MVATCAISVCSSTSRADLSSRSDTSAAARSMPRLRSIGLAPAATERSPRWTIACASTVAVVVPSPATSFVLVATSLATVTPSLVIVGAPHFLSMTTLRPRGPSVTFTVSASLSTPRSRLRRASSSNSRILGIDLPQPTGWMSGQASGLRPRLGSQRPDGCEPLSFDLDTRALRPWPHQKKEARNYFSMTASTSRAESTRYSSPEYLTSVPPYLLYSTTSPTWTSTGTRAPLSSTRPGPTAITLPSWGFSFAVSGITSPDAVTCSASSGWTTIRSSSGLRTTLVAVVTI